MVPCGQRFNGSRDRGSSAARPDTKRPRSRGRLRGQVSAGGSRDGVAGRCGSAGWRWAGGRRLDADRVDDRLELGLVRGRGRAADARGEEGGSLAIDVDGVDPVRLVGALHVPACRRRARPRARSRHQGLPDGRRGRWRCPWRRSARRTCPLYPSTVTSVIGPRCDPRLAGERSEQLVDARSGRWAEERVVRAGMLELVADLPRRRGAGPASTSASPCNRRSPRSVHGPAGWHA